MFGRLLNTLLYIMLFADVLERRFPAEFQRIIVSLSYNCIYLFSRLQILLSQTNTRINAYIDSNPRLLKIKNDVKEFITPYRSGTPVMQEFIRNGKPIQLFKKGNTDDDNNYDFGTVSYFSDVDNCINTRIVYKGDNTDGGVALSNTSNIKFILMELILDENNKYKIDLKCEQQYNYNVVGNKFTGKFFKYYLRKHLNVEDEELLAKLEEDFVVKIIDHKIDTIGIKFVKGDNDYIEILKDGYGFVGTEIKKEEIKESELIE